MSRHRLLLALLLALAAVGSFLIVTQPSSSRQVADFTIDYSAGRLIAEGRFAAPYDQPALAATMLAVAPASGIDPRLPFNKPLAAALPFVPLSALPLELAFRVWQIAGAAALLLALLLLQRAAPLGRRAVPLGALAVLAAVPAWAAFTEGQPTPLLALGAALAFYAWRTDQLAAGALGGLLLAVKPQYLPWYLLIMLAGRRWRLAAAAAGGAALMLLSPLAAGGFGGLFAMAHNALGAGEVVPARLSEAWVGVLALVLPSTAISPASLALYAASLAVLGWLAWRQRLSIQAFAGLSGWLAVLASPHALPHDLLILMVPSWLGVALWREHALPSPIVGLLLTDLALLLDLHGFPIVVGPLAMTGVLLCYGWAFRQRTRRRAATSRAA